MKESHREIGATVTVQARQNYKGKVYVNLDLGAKMCTRAVVTLGLIRLSGLLFIDALAMEKRSLNLSPQKPLKKPKSEDDSRKNGRRTRYFFGPVNTLTHKSEVRETTETVVLEELKTESKPIVVAADSSRRSNENYDKLVRALQSSDDSFDGIRWKQSPSKNGIADTHSSPLRNSALDRMEVFGDSHTKTGENGNSDMMLHKYGFGFSNIAMTSQQPALHKTQSDLTALTSGNKEQTIHARKSTSYYVPSSVLAGKESNGLNNWLSKLDTQEPKKESTLQKVESTNVAAKNGIQELSDAQSKAPDSLNTILDDMSFSEFSDSTNCSSPLKVNCSLPMPQVAEVETDEESSDFSNDSELDQLLLGSLPSRTVSQPNLKVSPKKQDLERARSFHDGVKKFEQLQLASFTANEDVLEFSPKISFNRGGFARYQIKNISASSYVFQNSKREQLILDVLNSKNESRRLLIRGQYLSLSLEINDIIHIVITDPSRPNLVDDERNLLIWHPDVLISATTVAELLYCERKTVLKSKFAFPGEVLSVLLTGIMTHRIFQDCIMNGIWSIDHMNYLLDEEIESYLGQIYTISPDVNAIREEVSKNFPYLEFWFQKYYKTEMGHLSSIPKTGGKQVKFALDKALAVEENIWSPMYGIKGMVDATLSATLDDATNAKNCLIPMEIKSGRPNISHLAQSSLYTLLFADRYDIEVKGFLLVYTKERMTKYEETRQSDLKSLVNLRNKLALYFKSDVERYPDLLKLSFCDRCELQSYCMTVNKLTEDGTPESSGIDEAVYLSLTEHLSSPIYKQFYNHWIDLISKEEFHMWKSQRDLWQMSADERENTDGRGVGGLKITSAEDCQTDHNGFNYTFMRVERSERSLLASQILKTDKVVISDEKGHFGLGQGFVSKVSRDFIVVNTRRLLFDTNLNENMLRDERIPNLSQSQARSTFRIDKDPLFHGMGMARFNILNLFTSDGDAKRRRLIVELDKPIYDEKECICPPPSLNGAQAEAFNKVISSKDYSLILGMPGTGKTTVIVHLIKYLVGVGKSILLTAYTHSAVDNILLKLIDSGIDILRVGPALRVHERIKRYVINESDESKIDTYASFKNYYMKPLVVATTCLGVSDLTFNVRKEFDYCIIDEASQVSLPISIGPLRFCKTFVLVGDHYQLPPLVQHPNPHVRKDLSTSLFKLLATKHPNSVVELTQQYRMNADIMKLTNVLIYENKLKCGSESVACRQLKIPNPTNIDRYSSAQRNCDNWFQWITNNNNSVLFLDHDRVPCVETKLGDKIENPGEAVLIKQIVLGLIACGVKPQSIGVLSLYRAQLRLLKRDLKSHPEVEILTADQYQGRDKDCIIISLVRSNPENTVGDLLQEWRRVNVAITRAMSKLVILGSKSTLMGSQTTKAFVQLLDDNGWVYKLPKGAEATYSFESLQSQPVQEM